MTARWNIIHLELSKPLPALPAEPGIQGIFAVFWWHGVPLGEREIVAGQLPMPAAHLAELAVRTITPAVRARLSEREPGGRPSASSHVPHPHLLDVPDLKRPLERLWGRLRSLEDDCPSASVSVVICTRDRPEALRRCLRSLRRLTPRPQEVLVVDNAPRTDATRRLVRQSPGVRYVKEPRPGLSAARNAGIRASTGKIIAFTDDDITAHSAWIARLRQAFTAPDVMAATGLVLPAELETEAQLLFQRGHSGFGWGYQPRTFGPSFFASTQHRGVPVWQIGAGANMAFRREAFEHVGFFDERLGAGASGCSEDSEMWYRVLAEGGQCRYEPASVVFHYHRREMDGLRRQMYQYMRGHVAALLIQFEKFGHRGNLRRAFLTLPRYYARRWLRRALRGASGPNTLGHEMRGCPAGLAYYLRHRHVAPAAERTTDPASPDPETLHA